MNTKSVFVLLRSFSLLRMATFLSLSFFCVPSFAVLLDLSQQKLIRVYISNAPGMGHQSASVVVMRRLRQLGFGGTFEVIYNDNIAGKLNTLIPGIDPQRKDWQDIKDQKIRAILESSFQNISNLPAVDIAISGADDNWKNMTAEKLFSKNYLLLEPQGWGNSFLFQEGVQSPKVIPGLENLGYFYEIESSQESIESNLADAELNPEFADKVSGLRVILGKEVIMGAIYGVGLIPNMPERIKIWVQGIQMAERSQKFTKPVVLPIISPLNEFEMQTLKWELGLLERTQSGPRKKRWVLMDIKDPNLPQVFSELNAGDILLVQTGRLPQSLFEVLFARSVLPVLVAGKNAMNLAQNLGKTYINTVNDYGFQMSQNETKEEKTIREASEVFFFSKIEDKYIRRLSKFIQESLNSQSSVSQYFKNLGPQGKDKVAEALRFLYSEAEGSASLCGKIFL